MSCEKEDLSVLCGLDYYANIHEVCITWYLILLNNIREGAWGKSNTE